MGSTSPRISLRILVGVLLVVTLLSVLSGLLPQARDHLRLGPWIPFQVHVAAHLTTVVSGFCLLSLLNGLVRRKRAAWALACFLLGISSLAHLLRGFEWEQALLSLTLLAWLASRKNDFRARSDRPSMIQGLYLLAGSCSFVLTYGTLGYWLLDRHYRHPASISMAMLQTLAVFVPNLAPLPIPLTRFAGYYSNSLLWIGELGAVGSLFLLLRPSLLRRSATPEEQLRARQLVTEYGDSSLAAFTLLPDKNYYFSPGGSLIAYGVRGRIAVVLGDPIGPEPDFGPAIVAFRDMCQGHDWVPAFLQVPDASLPTYQELGFSLVGLGQEAIVDVQRFTLAGNKNSSLRSTVKRLQRQGYRTQLHQPPMSSELVHSLQGVSDAWLERQAGQEKGFTMGWFDRDLIQTTRVLAVYSPLGRLEAFATLVPEFQRPELSVDLMRRLPDSAPGVMDFLFVELFQVAAREGHQTFSLGLSPLAGVGEDPDDPLPDKLVHFVYHNLDRFYNFEGLHRFKDKFASHWSARHLAYPPGKLPVTIQAVIALNSGDDFLWRQAYQLLQKPLAVKAPAANDPA